MIALSLAGCVPDSVKEKVDTAMKDAQEMLADESFKDAIANIELHRLRYGSYPNTLADLKFLTAMDSSIMSAVEYIKLDSGYELNTKSRYASIRGETQEVVQLDYPPEFWQGLGCIRSNLRDDNAKKSPDQ